MIEKLTSAIKNFGDIKFKIKNTEFDIVKLPPMSGFKVVENIRETLAATANKFDGGAGTEEESATLFFKAVLGLPPSFIDYLMSELFEHVQFSGGAIDKGWAKLKGLEDTAFDNFEVINIYEVLARALYVNFSGSFIGIMSAFPGAEQTFNPLSQKI